LSVLPPALRLVVKLALLTVPQAAPDEIPRDENANARYNYKDRKL